MTPQQIALAMQGQSMVQPVGDVIPGPKRWFSGEVPTPPLLGPMAGGGGGGGGFSEPSAKDSAQTDFPSLPAELGGGPDFRMPLADKQKAVAQTLMSAKQANEAFRNKWSAWAFKNGMDPAATVKAVTQLNANTDADLTDNLLKFKLAQMHQQGLLK